VKTIATLLFLVLLVACKREASGVAGISTDSVAAAPQVKAVAAPQAPRMIVRNAAMHIVVADTAKTVDAVTTSVEALGGYVAGSEVWREGELLRARLTLRVPSAKLSPALTAIRSLSRRVENETVSSEDVTQQYVDLSSQLRNLEATEVELRELLATVRKNARKAADILEVHQQLTTIRGEIETTKGRMQHLSQTAAMSVIALEIVPDAITQPVAEGEWQPVVVVKDASRALLAALRNIAAAAIWIVIYAVPICGIIALAAWALVAVARSLRRRIA
jgi:Domain of unknown function (DUF4349)